jgi:hypothetical protein
MSHVKSNGATHNNHTIKMVWLILGIEKYGETDRIDMSPDVHIEVSHTHTHDATHS